MPLSAEKKAYLKYLGERGDALAAAAYAAVESGSEKIVVLDNVAQASPNNLVTTVSDNAANALTVIATAGGTPLHATHPRNVYATFGASWAGGDIVVTGTDQFGATVSETLASNAGSTRVGNVAFKTITSIAKTVVGAGGAGHDVTVGSGSKLAVGDIDLHSAFISVIVGGATYENPSAVDLTYNTITFTTPPNNTNDYQVLCRSV